MDYDKKIEGKFYPLTPDTAKKLREANLTAAEWRLWSYLVELDPFGDRYLELPNTLTIMQECDIKKSTFYAAIAKLQALELFDFQDRGILARNLAIPKNRKVVQKIGNDSDFSESCPKNRKVVRETGKDSENSENQPPEPLPEKDSGSPQTIQTYSDFKKTLSEDERENFLNFVTEQIKNLPKQVNDVEAWLANKNSSGQNRWEVYYNNFLASQKREDKARSKYPSLRDEIEQRRANVKKRLREAPSPDSPSDVQEAIALKEDRSEERSQRAKLLEEIEQRRLIAKQYLTEQRRSEAKKRNSEQGGES
jgi:hypothetical protein